jgi:hypothetical protein
MSVLPISSTTDVIRRERTARDISEVSRLTAADQRDRAGHAPAVVFVHLLWRVADATLDAIERHKRRVALLTSISWTCRCRAANADAGRRQPFRHPI